jgi:hypothetical protein
VVSKGAPGNAPLAPPHNQDHRNNQCLGDAAVLHSVLMKSPKRARTQYSDPEFGAGRSSMSTITPTAPHRTCGGLYFSMKRTLVPTKKVIAASWDEAACRYPHARAVPSRPRVSAPALHFPGAGAFHAIFALGLGCRLVTRWHEKAPCEVGLNRSRGRSV